jgi:hypothetical protein
MRRYDGSTLIRYLSATKNNLAQSASHLFSSLLCRLMRSVCVLTILCLLFSIPIYVLKLLDEASGNEEEDLQYVTHSHMYNWLWTMAFLSGTTPAIFLLVMCLVCLFYFVFVMNRLGGTTEDPPTSAPLTSLPSTSDHHLRKLTVGIIFILNVGVVGTVNGLYLWSTLLDLESDIRIWIQFSFGLFSFLWNSLLRRGIPSQIKESKSGVWLFTCLNVINSAAIPCVVTALSSPSCYQVCYELIDDPFPTPTPPPPLPSPLSPYLLFSSYLVRDFLSPLMKSLPLIPINLVFSLRMVILVSQSVSNMFQGSWMY